jgi:UbiA prenyltransferase family protein
MSLLRVILTLVRPARLPGVWSNCLTGCWLGGAGHLDQLPILLVGATLLYIGGAFLNDAFDADYDRLNRPLRPIPRGQILQTTVWRWGVGVLVAGSLLLMLPGMSAGALGLALVCCIVVYNAVHTLIPLAPALEGLCRFFLYLIGAVVAGRGVTGSSVWCGLALAAYVTGIGYLSKWRDSPKKARYWPAGLLGAPLALALVMDVGPYRESGLLLSAVLGLWVLRCLRQTYWSLDADVSRTVAGLIPGIVFVDWLAVCPASFAGQVNQAARATGLVFLVLFAFSLLLQKLWPPRMPKAPARAHAVFR